MKSGLVTVVLPIYNVEKYLDRCIFSVVNQTYKSLEILLIDDGSQDGCPAICDAWAQKDSRIRVIHKENQGLGMARNTGIENATGECICFFDADDYIVPETVEKSYSLFKKEASDIVIFGYHKINGQGEAVDSFVPSVGNRVYSGEEVLEDFFPDFLAPSPYVKEPRRFYMSAWVLMYSMEMIQRSGWRFVSERDIIAEDVYSMLTLFQYVNKVAVLPQALYCYCENEVSLSRSYRSDRYERIKHFYLEGLKVCESIGYGDEILHRLSKPYVSFTIAALKQECKVNNGFKEKLKAVKRISDDDVLRSVLRRNKSDVVGISRRILFFTLRNRFYFLSTFLLQLKA